jgi:hypothetical protein
MAGAAMASITSRSSQLGSIALVVFVSAFLLVVFKTFLRIQLKQKTSGSLQRILVITSAIFSPRSTENSRRLSSSAGTTPPSTAGLLILSLRGYWLRRGSPESSRWLVVHLIVLTSLSKRYTLLELITTLPSRKFTH